MKKQSSFFLVIVLLFIWAGAWKMCKMKSTSKKKSLNLFNHSWSGFRCLMEVILSCHTNYPFMSSPPHRTFSISRKESEVILFGLSFKIKGNKM